jgi:hypothetical protein
VKKALGGLQGGDHEDSADEDDFLDPAHKK